MKKTRLRLVILTQRHVTRSWLSWMRNAETKQWIFAAKSTRTLRDLRETVATWAQDPLVIPYAIEASWKPGVWVHIGNVKADISIDEETGRKVATVGILMSPAVRGLGYGAAALKKVVRRLRYNFPSLLRVDAGIHGRNWASCRAFEKAGFTVDYPPQIWAARKFQ